MTYRQMLDDLARLAREDGMLDIPVRIEDVLDHMSVAGVPDAREVYARLLKSK